MGDGMLAVVGVIALVLGLLQWLVKGPWDPAENITSWLGNRATVMVRTVIAVILILAGVIGAIWGLVSMI